MIILSICILMLTACQQSSSNNKTLSEQNMENNEQDQQEMEQVASPPTENDQDNLSEKENEDGTEEKEAEEEGAKENKNDQDDANENSTKETIKWGEFFDEGDQTTPSEKFKSLKDERVEIKGWMGEVLNLNQGWFLLISAPGAECPFCSEDESYWNEIMIVFVDNASSLRYTKEPLLVEGTLDVGIKIDESNYKTMFRLYDATFTPI